MQIEKNDLKEFNVKINDKEFYLFCYFMGMADIYEINTNHIDDDYCYVKIIITGVENVNLFKEIKKDFYKYFNKLNLI
jgi:hypothetical protein